MAKSRRSSRPELSRLELDVMNTVWDLGTCSSAEVIEAFHSKRKLAPTTIRTVLANLRKKNYLEPVPTIERGFRLRPLVSREEVARRSLRDLVSGLFGGSPHQAIAYLLKDESIDPDELEEIREMIEDYRKGESDHE